MEFLIKWADGEIKWDRWNTSKDSFAKTAQFQLYIDKYPELRRLKFTRAEQSQEETRVSREGHFEFEPDEYFYHDMESYGTLWFQKLQLPGVPERRYYSQFKVLRRERKHLVVQDMDIPVGNRASSEVWFRPVDMLWLANKTIPAKGVRISRELIRNKRIKQP